MLKKIYKVVLDLKKGMMGFETINFTSEDLGGNEIEFTLLDNSTPLTFGGVIFRLAAKNPNGGTYQQNCTVSGNVVKATLKQDFFNVAGIHHAELQVYDATNQTLRVSFPEFRYLVSKSIMDDDTVQGDNNFSILQDMIDNVQNADKTSREALQIANQAKGIVDVLVPQANTASQNANEALDRALSVVTQEELRDKITLDNTQANFNFLSRGDSIYGLQVDGNTYDFASDVKKYSVRFSGSNPKGVREDDAIGMVAEVGTDAQIVRNDFDSVSFFDRLICCGDYQADGSFKINAYKGEPTFATDGSNGNVWRECKPFYYKGDIDNYVSVTETPLEGYKLAPGFKNGTDKVYLPCEFMSLLNGKPASVSGQYPLTGSCNSFMAEARKYNANAHLETIEWLISDYILQAVEFATKDMQTVMMGCCNLRYNGDADTALENGTNTNRIIVAANIASNYVVGQTICIGTSRSGDNVKKITTITAIEDSGANKAIVFDGDPVNITVGNFISSRPYKCGATNVVTASSGSPVSNTNGKYPCIWRGKVSPWGDGFSTLCNVLIKRYGVGTAESPYSYKPNYLQNPTKYANVSITDDYVELAYNLPVGDGYVKTLGVDNRYEHVRITETVGGASTTYHGAYYYCPRYDLCSARVGGFFGLGRTCSPVSFSCSYAPSTAHLSSLSRLFVYRS